MKKYRHVFAIGIQNNLTYRFNYLTRTLFSFIPLFAMLSLWRMVYSHGNHPRAGYTATEIVFYYILVAVVDVFTAVNEDDWQIATDIREGVDYLWYRLSLFFAGRVTFISMASVPLAIFIFCFKDYFIAPANGIALVAFPISLLLTALLQFFISYAMAMLAFWLLEISTFIFILFAFEYIASGHLFPLVMLPAPLFHTLMFTPFPSMLYTPISIYMGKISGADIGWSLLVQLFWVLLAFGFARFMWNRGVKKYSAFGG
jgi:ABC-2 type transport system permease protein